MSIYFVNDGSFVVCWCQMKCWKPCFNNLLNKKGTTLLCELFILICNVIVRSYLLTSSFLVTLEFEKICQNRNYKVFK
jgi:hypothetical protein